MPNPYAGLSAGARTEAAQEPKPLPPAALEAGSRLRPQIAHRRSAGRPAAGGQDRSNDDPATPADKDTPDKSAVASGVQRRVDWRRPQHKIREQRRLHIDNNPGGSPCAEIG